VPVPRPVSLAVLAIPIPLANLSRSRGRGCKANPDRAQPRYLAKAASRAVTPINPAAQKFHRFILCSAFDNSVTLSRSSMPWLMLGKRHMADRNQNAAEPHAVVITPVSTNDLIVIPCWFRVDRDYTANPGYYTPGALPRRAAAPGAANQNEEESGVRHRRGAFAPSPDTCSPGPKAIST
jgi:hypothetical protein